MNDHHPGAGTALTGDNLLRDDVDQPWEQDNQAWWDWYVTLADNGPSPLDGNAPAPTETAAATTAALPPGLRAADDARLLKELNTPLVVPAAAVARFRRDGYVKLAGVLSPPAVARLRGEMLALLGDAYGAVLDGGVRDRFLSLEMVWLEHPIVRAFVTSPRIAGIGAQLLGVPRVRLYHDNLMSKEPGCGRTPWHYDDHHFPLDTQEVVTAWIPAQAIPRLMGPLAFARPIEAWKLVRDVPFSKFDTSYDRRVSEVFAQAGLEIDDGPFALGEVSFHHNLSFHTAGANRSRFSRVVLANTYFADGARVVANPTMVSGDWEKFMPGVSPGEVAASPLNPICWPASGSAPASASATGTGAVAGIAPPTSGARPGSGTVE